MENKILKKLKASQSHEEKSYKNLTWIERQYIVVAFCRTLCKLDLINAVGHLHQRICIDKHRSRDF